MSKVEKEKVKLENKEYNRIIFKDAVFLRKATENKENQLKEALEIALQNRKLEIELTWKRATYFSVLIGAIAIAYTSVIDNNNDHAFLKLLLPGLGLIFSFAWFLVNRGSKFWQENWEHHSDFLSRQFIGNISNIILTKKKDRLLVSARPFSVSRISIAVSLIVTLAWFIIFIYQSILHPHGLSTFIENAFLAEFIKLSFLIFPVGLILFILWRVGKSSFVSEDDSGKNNTIGKLKYYDLKKK